MPKWSPSSSSWNFVQILVFNSLLPLDLQFGFATTPLEFFLPGCVLFRGSLDNLGLGPAGADNLSILHPQEIVTTSPAVVGWAYIGGVILVIAQRDFGLVGISTSIARGFHEESLADQHAACNILDLVPVILRGLRSCKDGWKHAALG